MTLISALLVIIVSATFAHGAYRLGSVRDVLLCPFWYFTIIFVLGYPVRASLLYYDLIETQVDVMWAVDYIPAATFLSGLFWIASYIGYRTIPIYANLNVGSKNVSSLRVNLAMAGSMALAGMFCLHTVLSSGSYSGFSGNEQNEMRVGSGGLFLMADLYISVYIAFLGHSISKDQLNTSKSGYYLITVSVLVVSLFMTIVMNSRRMVAIPLFAAATSYLVTRKSRSWWGPMTLVAASILALPLLQVVRYLSIETLLSTGVDFSKFATAYATERQALTIISSSIEGVDHLAAYLAKGGVGAVLFGRDGGLAWSFNSILALVPRDIWSSKPLLYGSVAEQAFLYPDMFRHSVATTTIPVSFCVDFLFGFGIGVGLLMAFFLGRALGGVSARMRLSDRSTADCAIGLFVYTTIFNLYRSGTAWLSSVLVFIVICMLAFGVRTTLSHAVTFASEVLLKPALGQPRRAGQR